MCFKVESKLTGLKYIVHGVRYENKYTFFLIYDGDSLEWKWVLAENYRPI